MIGLDSHAVGSYNMNYQGEVIFNGSPANGIFTMTFSIYDANFPNIVLESESHNLTIVDGLVTTELSFNASNFIDGLASLMGVVIEDPNTQVEYALEPKVKINHVPYAIVSESSNFAYDIASNSVYTSTIVDNTIQSSDILDNTIQSSDIRDNTITSFDILNNTIQGADILNNTITSFDILNSTIQSIDIRDNTIQSSDILDGTITAHDLSNNSISLDKLSGLGITDGNVIQFNGTTNQWEANALPVQDASPWIANVNDIYFESGNIGIGTSNPISTLHLEGNANDEILLRGNTTSPVIHFRRTANSADWVLKQNPDGTKFHIQTELTDGHEVLTLAATGEVGIGTTNPTGMLDVRNNSNEILLNVNSNGIIKRKTKTSFLTLSYHAFQTTNSQENYIEVSAGTIDGFTNEPLTTAIKLVAPINLPVNQATIIGFELLSFDNDPAASITARIYENDFLIENTPSEIVALTSGISVGEEHLSNNSLNHIYLQNSPYYVHVTLPAQGILGTDLVFSAVRISYQYDEL